MNATWCRLILPALEYTIELFTLISTKETPLLSALSAHLNQLGKVFDTYEPSEVLQSHALLEVAELSCTVADLVKDQIPASLLHLYRHILRNIHSVRLLNQDCPNMEKLVIDIDPTFVKVSHPTFFIALSREARQRKKAAIRPSEARLKKNLSR